MIMERAMPPPRRAQETPEDQEPHNRTTIYVLVALFAVAEVLDIVTTSIGLHTGSHEGNPLAARILQRYGEWTLYGMKLGVVVLIALATLRGRKHWRALRDGLRICVLIVGLTVLSNAHNIAQNLQQLQHGLF